MSAPASSDLLLELTLNAPREAIWRCYTESDLLKQWYCPKPWGISEAIIDVRAGGRQLITMQSPEGEQFPGVGVYLEVITGERLVYTNLLAEGWLPSPVNHMDFPCLVDLTFKDAGPGKTRYLATVRHWSEADSEKHAQMGFTDGWTAAARQLEELAAGLQP